MAIKPRSRIQDKLSRRERQIMDALFRLGEATAAQVLQSLPDPPSYSAIRAHLRTLEEKGHVQHRASALRYVYFPTMRPDHARRSALAHMVETFFGGSAAQAAAALLDQKSSQLTPSEWENLARLIEQARKDGR